MADFPGVIRLVSLSLATNIGVLLILRVRIGEFRSLRVKEVEVGICCLC